MVRKMSDLLFVSPDTRFGEFEPKLTYLPSDEIEGLDEPLFPCVPQLSTETLSVSPVVLSWTKVSHMSFVYPETRLEAYELKLTYLPSDEMEGEDE